LETPENLKEAIPVLDKGFVRLVDSMGDDSAIVQAARVSYGNGTKTVREDAKLIDYLMRNDHTSPFEMPIFRFHLKMPIFVARQWVRHRKGSVADEQASMNEISGRYSEMKDEFYLPDRTRMVKQSAVNKQGSSEIPIEYGNLTLEWMATEQHDAYENYKDYLHHELARETARINLPLSLYTEFYWQIDLHNLLHFLRLRLDRHAQYEIRVYAQAILSIIERIVPATVSSWKERKLNTVSLNHSQLSTMLLDIDTDIDSVKKQISKLLEEANVYTD
jgi:thymidylate synthase (FAD)